jgi:hypothetical protein
MICSRFERILNDRAADGLVVFGYTALMQSNSTTVKDYLATLPPDRRADIETVRKVILKNLDKDYEEGMLYGMIGYYVPHRVYPAGYHCDPTKPLCYAALASQKNYMSLYLMCYYGSPELKEWFQKAWKASGKKLDAGKSCIRFKSPDDLALDVVGQVIAKVPPKKYIAVVEGLLESRSKPAKKKPAAGGAKKAKAK